MRSAVIEGDFRFPARPWLLYFMVFSISVDYVFLKGLPGLPQFRVIELASYLVLMFLFLDSVIFFDRLAGEYRSFIRSSVFLHLYFFWVALVAIVHFLSGSGVAAIAQFKDLVPSLVLTVIIYFWCDSKARLNNVVKVLLVGVFLNAILGTLQGLFGKPRPIALSETSAFKLDVDGKVVGDLMATGWFGHPNGFALYMIAGAVLVLLVLINRISLGKTWRVFSLFVAPLLLFSLYKTHGKGAMAWVAVALALSFLIPYLGRLKWWICTIATCSIVAIIVIAAINLSEHMTAFRTIFTRIQLWNAAFFALSGDISSFFTGGAQYDVLKWSYRFTGGKFIYPNAHNGIINQAVFYGVPALFFYVIMVFAATYRLSKAFYDKSTIAFQMPGVATFVMASIFGLFGEYFFEPTSEGVILQAQFFLLIGLALAMSRPAVTEPASYLHN